MGATMGFRGGAGYYVQRFCRSRNIATDNIELQVHTSKDPETRMISKIDIEIRLPSEFPQKYDAAVVRAAETCAVKKHVERCVMFETRVTRLIN